MRKLGIHELFAQSKSIAPFQSLTATRSRPKLEKNILWLPTPWIGIFLTSTRCEQSRSVATIRERTRTFVPWKIRANSSCQSKKTTAKNCEQTRLFDRAARRDAARRACGSGYFPRRSREGGRSFRWKIHHLQAHGFERRRDTRHKGVALRR